MTEWEKIESTDFHSWEDQPELEGELKDIEQGQYGPNYVITDKDGNDHLVAGSTVLQSRLAKAEKGDKVRLVYKGEAKGKSGRVYHDFDVYRAK